MSDFETKQNPSHLDKSVSPVSKWVFAGGGGGRVEGAGSFDILRPLIPLSPPSSKYICLSKCKTINLLRTAGLCRLNY